MSHDLRPSVPAERYLADLERAAAALPANRRAELLADVRSHIAVARAEAEGVDADDAGDDAAVTEILRQLGDPQDIAAAAISDLPAVDSRPTTSALREASALVLLIIGGFLFWLVPVVSWIGWIVGLVLLCLSRRWGAGDKLIGVAGVALAPLVLTGSVVLTFGTESCTGSMESQGPLPGPNEQADTSSQVCTTTGGMPPVLTVGLAIVLLAAVIYATIRLTRRIHQKDVHS